MSAVSARARRRRRRKFVLVGQKDIVIDEALLRQRGGEMLRLRAGIGIVRQLPHHGAAQHGQKAFQRNVGVGRRDQKRDQKRILCQRREARVSQQLREGKPASAMPHRRASPGGRLRDGTGSAWRRHG